MRFLITTPLKGWKGHPLDAGFITYLPELDPTGDLCAEITGLESPDIWIADGKEILEKDLTAWRIRKPLEPLGIVLRDFSLLNKIQEWADRARITVIPFPQFSNGNAAARMAGILHAGENLYARGLAGPGLELVQKSSGSSGKKVVLVGAGIVNLVCAEYLASRNYQVEIVDASPDPRHCREWQKLGVSSGGGNARMYTRTEADNYNEKGSEIYQDMKAIFRTPVLEGGWCVKHPDTFSIEENEWVTAFEGTPPWLARIFSQNIFETNRQSGLLWDAWMENHPELFEGVTLRSDILRMYVEPHAVDAAKTLHLQLGAMVQDESRDSFLEAYPVFRDAEKAGEFAGGFRVQGFTLNIHPFMRRLIVRIESLGGKFHWDCRIKKIERDERGEVYSLRGESCHFSADHYILSPGVGGNEMLRGTLSENLLQGTLGTWLQIPNLEPKINHSIKIHRRGHLVEDINVTVAVDEETGEDILIFGGGYGFTGLDRPEEDSPDLNALFAELEEVAKIYFPEGYARAKAEGTLFPRGERRFCIRPFTPTGLGIFEMLPAKGGGQLIITGGHNTGGFAQAPAIARAVWNALNGIEDPMHTWFHPARAGMRMHLRRQPQAPSS